MKNISRKIVLYIDMMERGGAQRVVANLVQYFSEQRISTVLVNDFKLEDSKPQYTVNPAVKRYYLRDCLNGNVLLKNIERIVHLRRIIKEEKPDVVLSFLGRPNERMLLATIGLRTKKIVSVRNDPNHEYSSRGFFKWFARNLFRLADGCVFQTEDAACYFPESVQKKATIILNPVDLKFFNITRSKHPQNIVTVGRLEAQKNQELLIKAFAEISKDFPDEKLIIYGEGSLKSELEKLCQKLQIENKVKVPGNISDVEIALSNAKIFVLPSNYEGLPNALMEAMAVGIPCISTDCPCGGPKILAKKNNALQLIPVNDKNSLVAVLRTFLQESEVREFFAENAKDRAESFRPEQILIQWKQYMFQEKL